MSIKVECYPVINEENIFSFYIIDNKHDGYRRNMSFYATIEETEEIANQLLQAVFEITEGKAENRYQIMWKYILTKILDGEPYMSEFHRFVDRLVFNRFEPYNGDFHLTSNAINKNVIGNVINCIFDVVNGYDTGGHPVMKIIIHDNIDKKEYHFKFNGEKQVIAL